MSDPDQRDLGLFPLGMVLLPGERVPLHIFEPRYRALIADCTLAAQPFVLSLAADDGVARIGCTAHPDALLRRFADGRMNIVVVGGERVEIVEQTSGEPYLTARVRVVPDLDATADAAVAAAVTERFRRLAETVAGAPREPDVTPEVPLSLRGRRRTGARPADQAEAPRAAVRAGAAGDRADAPRHGPGGARPAGGRG